MPACQRSAFRPRWKRWQSFCERKRLNLSELNHQKSGLRERLHKKKGSAKLVLPSFCTIRKRVYWFLVTKSDVRCAREKKVIFRALPGVRLSKNCQAESFGGKKSVKGNRQGFLSRQITRRSGRIAKSCYKILFAIRKVACQRSPKGPWQARSARPDHRLPTANSKFLRTSSRRNSRRDFFHLPHCILLKITGYFL